MFWLHSISLITIATAKTDKNVSCWKLNRFQVKTFEERCWKQQQYCRRRWRAKMIHPFPPMDREDSGAPLEIDFFFLIFFRPWNSVGVFISNQIPCGYSKSCDKKERVSKGCCLFFRKYHFVYHIFEAKQHEEYMQSKTAHTITRTKKKSNEKWMKR